jgi:hypothetical protein
MGDSADLVDFATALFNPIRATALCLKVRKVRMLLKNAAKRQKIGGRCKAFVGSE